MERIMDMDERIRRAEELYNRRKMQGGIRVSTNTVNNSSRSNLSLFKKMIVKIIVCAIIYLTFYILKNSGMFFSQNVIEQTQKIMSYDINFNQVYSQAVRIFNDNVVAKIDNTQNTQNPSTEPENPQVQNPESENPQESDNVTQNNTESNVEGGQEEPGIGGADPNDEALNIVENAPAQTTVIQKTQMEIDAEYVKSNFSFIKPVQGIVTSRFGPREATTIISANHEGIDIGANTGTPIYASMAGTVTKVSSYGDYGKHFTIKNGDVVTLYAHCSQINVKVGQTVSQGQEVAKVGSTGRATGPHVHFEIQREDRVINPEYILDF